MCIICITIRQFRFLYLVNKVIYLFYVRMLCKLDILTIRNQSNTKSLPKIQKYHANYSQFRCSPFSFDVFLLNPSKYQKSPSQLIIQNHSLSLGIHSAQAPILIIKYTLQVIAKVIWQICLKLFEQLVVLLQLQDCGYI